MDPTLTDVLEEQLARWRGDELILHHDAPSGAWIILALHSSQLGPPTGGTRFKAYARLADAVTDALRLSEGMTRKYAVADFERGGGKAVIHAPVELDAGERQALLRRYGTLLRELDGRFYTGPDVGTCPADMDVIAETGAPYVFARTPAAGGAGSSGPYTALGVFAGIRAACAHVFGTDDLSGRRAVVQGVGSVGAGLVERLVDAGADVRFADLDAGVVQDLERRTGARSLDPGAVLAHPCDVLAPCALGGVLDARTIPTLRCRIVAGGANNPLATEGDELRLAERGILYVPDYAINIGGAMAITGMEALGWTEAEATERVTRSAEQAVRRILELSDRQGISTEEAARRLAEERLAG